ncbi:DNA polymerase III subunits gamma and tau [hydrothermal vent metagenome]|uniref:DNA-directed DNA polymerase n=1 Tax=hydrothermal vent metagenome TaxID=652676 RepID=A0A3B1C7V3_9ZZZZ
MEEKYTVSARKFRPQTFSEIIGQPHIVRTLTNAFKNKRIAHAYIFSGTRGVGKTSTARIVAKALNCEKGPTAQPCLECNNCKEIANGSSIDVMEIDGASNRGIDNIRELRENARFTPSNSTYKIYIIDEVHQITKDAFNALLKTLEEPPDHVIFLFATTELTKVPDTILSRCQSFEYRSISTRDIIDQLNKIAKIEGITIAPGASLLLARRANGSMRDAQSLFDQAVAYGGGSLKEADVKIVLGMVDRSLVFGVMDAVIGRDRPAVLKLSQAAAYQGASPMLFVEDLSKTVRDIMMAKVSPDNLDDFEDDEREKLKTWAELLDYDEIHRYFQALSETLNQMKYSPQPEINLEMGLLKLTGKRGVVKIDDLIDRVSKAQTTIEKSGVTPLSDYDPAPGGLASPPPPITPLAEAKEPGAKVDANVEPAPFEIEKSIYAAPPPDLLDALKSARPMLGGILESSTVHVSGDTVVITVRSLFDRARLEESDNKKSIENLAGEVLGKKVRAVVKFADEKKSLNSDNRKKKEAIITDKRRHMEDTPIIQKAIDIFNGEITNIKTINDI